MKKVTLHVGLEKTGSTYLQDVFFHNQEVLAQKGVHYAHAGIEDRQHYWIAKGLGFRYQPQPIDEAKEREALEALAVEYANCEAEYFFLSSEHFDVNLNLDSCKALIETFADASVDVVVVMRNQVDYARSRYIEHIKWGGIRTFREFLDVTVPRQEYDFDHKVATWEAAGANVRIVDYDKAKRALLEEFLACAGFPVSQEELTIAEQAHNVSPSIDFMELVRLSNVGVEPALRRDRYLRLLELAETKLSVLLPSRDWPFPPRTLPMIDEMQKSNRRLAQRLGYDPDEFLGGALVPRFVGIRDNPQPTIRALIEQYILDKPEAPEAEQEEGPSGEASPEG